MLATSNSSKFSSPNFAWVMSRDINVTNQMVAGNWLQKLGCQGSLLFGSCSLFLGGCRWSVFFVADGRWSVQCRYMVGSWLPYWSVVAGFVLRHL